MSTRSDSEPSDVVLPSPTPPPLSESVDKPRWTRPEITSFKPVADAQGVSYRIGDGISNLS
jgi:hypothetical protein